MIGYEDALNEVQVWLDRTIKGVETAMSHDNEFVSGYLEAMKVVRGALDRMREELA